MGTVTKRDISEHISRKLGLNQQAVKHIIEEFMNQVVEELADSLRGTAESLGCSDYLQRCVEIANGPSWAERQKTILEETGDPHEIVRQLTDASRITQIS